MSTRISFWGSIASIVIAIATAAYTFGQLTARVDTLEKQGIPERAMKKIAEREKEALDKLSKTLPPGSIIASYEKAAKAPAGWVTCGVNNTPSLVGRFLMGATNPEEIGTPVGEATHLHNVEIMSTGEKDGEHKPGKAGTPDDFADNIHRGVGETGPRNWYHRHQVSGLTKDAKNIPPSIRVFFFCKQTSQ